MTGTPASFKVRMVPPVEMISMPRAARALPNSTTPVLSDTLMSARFTFMLTYLLFLCSHDDIAADRQFVVTKECRCLDVGRMFLRQDPSCQRIFRIIFIDRHGRLQDNRPGIHIGHDEVNRAAGNLDAGFNSLTLSAGWILSILCS